LIFSRLPPSQDAPMLRKALFALLVAAPLAAQKPVITPKDFGKWESIGLSRLSPRGDWVVYGLSHVNEESELRLRGGPRDTTIVVAYGAAPSFSADGKWVAYGIGVSPAARERL